MPASKFSGFEPSLIHYLDDLARNNNRPWFNKYKSRYETDLLAPALAFIEAIAPPMAKISPNFRVVAKRTGGSLMRIYRDTRFAGDKRPYKTNVGIQFRHDAGRDVHAPGYYLHIEPDSIFLGAGLWRPDSAALGKIRTQLDEQQTRWKQIRSGKTFRDHFEPAGDSLKRPPRGYDADHPLLEDLKRKDHIAICHLTPDELFNPRIVSRVTSTFRKATSYMRFLCEAVEVPF